MNIVFIIPTGIGAEIGGHAGDASPVVKLFSSLCQHLITHPNAVNASDINEMPDNALYVEGSLLDRFLGGKIELEKACLNKVLVAVNRPVPNEIVNAVSAARCTLGAFIEIVELDTPLMMKATVRDGCASGEVSGLDELVEQVSEYEFDALALATPIAVDKEVALAYVRSGGVNPWGGVEAMVSKMLATALNVPVAHSPIDHTLAGYNEITDPRMAAEFVSICYIHCVLKGLHRAPRIGRGLSVKDVDFLISPWGCYGLPHVLARARGVRIVMVRENKTVLNNDFPDDVIVAENYLEAAGIVASYKAGVHYPTVRRPVEATVVYRKVRTNTMARTACEEADIRPAPAETFAVYPRIRSYGTE